MLEVLDRESTQPYFWDNLSAHRAFSMNLLLRNHPELYNM